MLPKTESIVTNGMAPMAKRDFKPYYQHDIIYVYICRCTAWRALLQRRSHYVNWLYTDYVNRVMWSPHRRRSSSTSLTLSASSSSSTHPAKSTREFRSH